MESEDLDCSNNESLGTPHWVNNGGFIALVFAIYASLYGIALVCEDYFVPSLNKLCRRSNIRGDVAGATLMAMGNSAPELFTSLISIFVTKSSLGIGTAIGSAIFNHLCICGVSAIYSPTGVVVLDWRILFRDSFFYLFSLITLVWALKGSFIIATIHLRDKSQNKGCLTVHWEGALAMIFVYALYVIVCAYYTEISVACCGPKNRKRQFTRRSLCLKSIKRIFGFEVSNSNRDSEWTVLDYSEENFRNEPLLSKNLNELQSIGMITHNNNKFIDKSSGDSASDTKASLLTSDDKDGPRTNTHELAPPSVHVDIEDVIEDNMFADDLMLDGSCSPSSNIPASSITDVNILQSTPSEEILSSGQSDLPFVPRNSRSIPTSALHGSFQCWLLKRSSFYSKLRISSRKWQLRFFVLEEMGFRYSKSSQSSKEKFKFINIFEAIHIHVPDGTRSPTPMSDVNFLFHVVTPGKTYVLRALTADVYKRLVYLLRRRISVYQNLPTILRKSIGSLHAPSRESISYKESSEPFEDSSYASRRELDFVNDTFSPATSHFDDNDSDNEFDDTVEIWEEIAKYSSVNESIVAHGVTKHTNNSSFIKLLLSHILQLLSFLNKLLRQSMRPLKWTIRKTIPRVLADDLNLDNDILQVVSFEDGDHEFVGRAATLDPENINSKNLGLGYTIFACIAWMGILSFILTVSAEIVGHLFRISSAVTGLTIAAAGTSFPSLLTSVIVTYQGQGDMAISNAFGSNVFCILIGLGVPWLLVILLSGGSPFDGIQDDGVVASVVLLILLLILFYICLFITNFRLYKWIGHVLLVTYILFVCYLLIFATRGL